MKRLVIIFGLIAGFIVSAFMLVAINLCYNSGSYESSMLIGYSSMIIAFSFVYVAVKNYRDKHNGGYISFGNAFKTGLYIVLIGSTMYVVTWLVDYYLFVPDFMDKLVAYQIEALKNSGATLSEIQQKTKELARGAEAYKSPLYVIGFTYFEVLPVGLIVNLICALILKRKPTNDLSAA